MFSRSSCSRRAATVRSSALSTGSAALIPGVISAGRPSLLSGKARLLIRTGPYRETPGCRSTSAAPGQEPISITSGRAGPKVGIPILVGECNLGLRDMSVRIPTP